VFLLFENIANGIFVIPDGLDPLLTNLLKGMLEKDPNDRLGIDKIFHHPYKSSF